MRYYRITLIIILISISACGCKNKPADNEKSDAKPTETGTKPAEKRLWAKSILWDKAPEFVVEKFIGPVPDMKGKYLLIEFWATWCPHCVRFIPKLNAIHEKYKDDLVVIGITDETEDELKKFTRYTIKYYSAIDTRSRMKDAIKVEGIPHAIIVEPEIGMVIWEGFPLQPGHELTEEIIDNIIKVGREKGVTGAGM